MKCSKSRVGGFVLGAEMSLDVMEFLREDFFSKYKKLESSWSSIDAPLRRLFTDYHSHLKGIDIASLQGEHPDLLYFLNCAVDDCLVESAESLHSMAKRSFRSCRKMKGLDLKTLEDNLTTIKSAISKRCGSSVIAPHKPASIPLLNYKVHGFEKQFDKIVSKISTTSDQGSSVVGIVGIGGSGKTTLASMVFNAREVREKYQIMIWASLTSTLNKKESTRLSVFREMLSGVQNNDSLKTMLQKIKSYQGGSSTMADHVLDKYIDHFKEALARNSGRYLIVLDDVWETEYWFGDTEELKVGQPKCILSRKWVQKTGGTLLVTSRLEEMAENIVGKRDLYMISSVKDDACFDIFIDRAIKDGYFTREDEHLKKLNKKEIVDKCFGLPLAACTVADIFVAEHREEAERAAMKQKEAAEDKAEVEGEGSTPNDKIQAGGDTLKPKAEAEAEVEGDTSKPKAEAEEEGDTLKPKTDVEGETEGEEDTLKPKAEGITEKDKIEAEGEADEPEAEGGGSVAKDKIESEGEGDTLKPKAEGSTEKDKIEAEGEADASKPKAEGSTEKDKIEAEGEADASKPKAEGSTEKDKIEAEGEGDASKPKAEPEAEVEEEGSAAKDKTTAMREGPEEKAKGKASPKAEVVASEPKVEAVTEAAEEAIKDAGVKETAPESSKEEEQALMEADASKAKTGEVLTSDIAPPRTRKLAQRVMKAFRKARETQRKTSEAEPSQ